MNPFSLTKYFSKKSFLKIFGGTIRIFDESKTKLLFYVRQKAFKLKEDISVYADESQSKELLRIKARRMLDIAATYDVVDSVTGEALGALRRKGLKSILKDEWEILSASGAVVGTIMEDRWIMAILRRFLSNLIPQTFHVRLGDKEVGIFHQTFNPFVAQYRIDFSSDTDNQFDRRLGISAVILLQIIEGRQN